MLYHSTRSKEITADSARAVLQGLAPDGGLFVPGTLPTVDVSACLRGSTQEMAARLLRAFLPDIPDMEALVRRAYAGKFRSGELTPTVSVGGFTVTELFRGPTSAFKDVALCMLPQLLTRAREVTGMEEEILILTATSGDTGKAALCGFQDVPGVKICVFYPHGGVSKIQRAQMVTQPGSNVAVFAIRGNFDDAQAGVKEIFSACRNGKLPGSETVLSSANSINIGRLVPQITYYFKTYRDLLDRGTIQMGQEVCFTVPTGNFGNILAGYLAKRLGLPVGKLVCASNANNVLTDFLRTGTYDRRRPLHKTLSPSMDILVSSNLERLLYFLSGEARVRTWMGALQETGAYTLPEETLSKLQAEFWGGFCGDARAKATIRRVWETHGYLLDTHTATAWAVAEDYVNSTGDRRPMAVLATASPYKFPAAVLDALGLPQASDDFEAMAALHRATGTPIPENLAAVATLPERHTGVIDRAEMLQCVQQLSNMRRI